MASLRAFFITSSVLAFTLPAPTRAAWPEKPVASVRRVVVASPGYLRQAGTPQHLRDFLKADCVRFTGGSEPWRTFHEGKRRFSVPVSGNLEFNHVAPGAAWQQHIQVQLPCAT